MSTPFKRGNKYYFRRRVPLDLVARLKKKEIVIALHTTDKALAQSLCHAHDTSYDILFQDERRPLSPGEYPRYWGPIPRTQLENEEEQDAAAWENEIEEERTERMAAFVAARLFRHMEELGIQLLPTRLLEATMEGVQAVHKAQVSSATAIAEAAPNARSMAAAFDAWERIRKPTSQPKDAMLRAVNRFKEIVGDLAVTRVTKTHIVQYRNKMEESGVKPTSISQCLANLHSLFNVAIGEAWIEINPAKGVKLEVKKKGAKAARPPFDVATLNNIFSNRIYTESYRPGAGIGEAAYWLPLLGLFTGARIEELVQLTPDDIYEEMYRDSAGMENKVWVVRITESEESGQSVKNFQSVRRIPLHSEIISRGFVDYVQSKRGQRRIFPGMKLNKHGVESHMWSQWWIRLVRNECYPTSPKMVFHSFRHTFKDVCRECGIRKEVADAMQGHSEGDSSGNYGAEFYPLRPLVEALETYQVHGVKLPAPVTSHN